MKHAEKLQGLIVSSLADHRVKGAMPQFQIQESACRCKLQTVCEAQRETLRMKLMYVEAWLPIAFVV